MTKLSAIEILKKAYGEWNFNQESAEFKAAENFEMNGNILTYTVNADSVIGYTVEVDTETGNKRTCGNGEGCFWTDWN